VPLGNDVTSAKIHHMRMLVLCVFVQASQLPPFQREIQGLAEKKGLQGVLNQLAYSGAAKPPPFSPFLFLFFRHAPSRPRDGTDVRVLYILILVSKKVLKSKTCSLLNKFRDPQSLF